MTTTARAQYTTAQPRLNLPFIIGASSVGTLIEWYDFYLYGVLAIFFSKHFFSPTLSEGTALILSLFVFWTGFLVRPFGAIVFGHLGDLIGRKFTFMLTLLLMGASTFVVGLLLTIVGLYQDNWLIGSAHWVIQVIHLLLGLSAIGLGEMIAARTRRRLQVQQQA